MVAFASKQAIFSPAQTICFIAHCTNSLLCNLVDSQHYSKAQCGRCPLKCAEATYLLPQSSTLTPDRLLFDHSLYCGRCGKQREWSKRTLRRSKAIGGTLWTFLVASSTLWQGRVITEYWLHWVWEIHKSETWRPLCKLVPSSSSQTCMMSTLFA